MTKADLPKAAGEKTLVRFSANRKSSVSWTTCLWQRSVLKVSRRDASSDLQYDLQDADLVFLLLQWNTAIPPQ